MKTTLSAIAIFAALIIPAYADDDGTLTVNGVDVPPPVAIDVAPDSIDRAELAPAVRGELDGLRSDVNDNADDIGDNAAAIAKNDADARESEARLKEFTEEGLATIAALDVPHVEKSFAASLNGGFYNDKAGVGVGAAFRLDQTFQFGGSLAIGTDSGDIAGKAKLTGQW